MGLLPLAAMTEQARSGDAPAPQVVRRAIPSSGEPLPVIGLGTYQALDVGSTAAEQEPLLDVVRALTDHGGTLIDSSPMYGRAESVAGDLVATLSLRPKVFLATKVWTTGRESGIRQMEESFRRMRTERMDLMQVHNLQDWRTHAETLDRWKTDGRIRYTGITHYHEGAYGELEKVLRARRWDFVQLNYSLAEPAAAERMLPLAAELGVAVIANRPFAQGALFSRVKGKALPGWAAEIDCATWAQVFLKWIVSHPAVHCAIPASSKVTHTVQNMLAGTGRMPDAGLRARIAKEFDAL
jgi:diketogulonate reductase-like aldo/keto reductase